MTVSKSTFSISICMSTSHFPTIWFNAVLLLSFLTMCTSEGIRVMDLKTPRNVHLSAFYKRSFAYRTVKDRMPVILTQTIDNLARSKEEIAQQYGSEGGEDLKAVIGGLSKLKYEIQTNKPLDHIESNASDARTYNIYIDKQIGDSGNITHFSAIWLLTECYMYRRIRQVFENTDKLKDFDPFRKQKETSYVQALPIIIQLSQYLTHILDKSNEPNQDDLVQLLKLNLWGNKCDLSLSNGVVRGDLDHLFDLAPLEPHILCDHSEKIWNALSNRSGSDIIDIIHDNAGYEVFTDFCLADYLITTKLAQKIRFYVKTIPWFVSDVMRHDFHWTIQQLRDNSNEVVKNLGQKWFQYVENGTWIMIESDFWTLPMDYSQMVNYDIALYRQLAQAKLVIFKGDLNYRKLFGEMNWDPVTPVEEALRGFHPSKLCTLRTIKADIVCGLSPGVAEKTEAKDEKWMETGNYGLIQFSDKIIAV